VPDTRQAEDLQRFERFSSGYLAQHPEDPALIIDVRYSMVPNRIDGLWGIRLAPDAPAQPAEFVTDRESTPEDRQVLWRMFAGPGESLGRPSRDL
jgi:inner membrane protein